MGRVIPVDARAVDAKLKYMREHFGGSKETARRAALFVYARTWADNARNGWTTDCQAFSIILSFAVAQFPNANDLGVEAMMEDLRSVLIGNGLENTQRSTGPFALRWAELRDTGFQEKFRDGGNQVQHAMAGLYISYTYGFVGTKPAMLIEDSKPDEEIYKVTFRLGSDLNASNYTKLPTEIQAQLGA
jgi:hypothetical protein